MKYLKRIFESVDMKELKDFCESYLSYLIDDGFVVLIDSHNILNIDFIVVNIVKKTRVGDGEMITEFKWLEIKDYIVPFITMLNKYYKLNTTWRDNQASIEIREPYESKNFTYKDFIDRADNHYFDDDVISYIEIILDN